MAHRQTLAPMLAAWLFASLAGSSPLPAVAQLSPAPSQKAAVWAGSADRPPSLQSAQILEAAPSGERLERMLLLLQPSLAKQQALTIELENQQNPVSPEFHRWLPPAAFADAYANSASDVASVVAWLQYRGFQVAPLPASRGWIEFSGTVAQVEFAFQTTIVSVQLPAPIPAQPGARAVLAREIALPASLKPLIRGLVSLDGVLSASAVTPPLPVKASAAEIAAETSFHRAEALTPQLESQLLHLGALHSAGILGAGQSIAIPTRSNVLSSDVAAFRANFSLPANPLQIVLAGPDPGRTADEPQAVLSASWAGAAAPGATIVLVPAATTAATDGVDLTLAAIVDRVLAHTVVVGYSFCEAAPTDARLAFYAALYRQAAAEGMAIIAATGDSGPSACHPAGSAEPVTGGFGVNALASTPWNTAVGVAAFSSAGPDFDLSAWSPVDLADPAYAGGAGRSVLYEAPNWQQPPAIEAPSARLLPDLVLPTASDTASNPGLAYCLSGISPSLGCNLVRSGGSSAAAAIFAGIAALVAEEYGPQGNLAPALYALSRKSGVFNDVRQGSAKLPCAAGSPGCDDTGQIGFSASEGYDLATGLGTVDAQRLVSDWPSAASVLGTAIPTVVLTPATTTPQAGSSLQLSISIAPPTGSTAAPTGSVTVTMDGVIAGTGVVTAGSPSTASITIPQVAAGSHLLQATYSGDTNYASATSPTVTVTAALADTVTLTSNFSASNPQQALVLTATVTPLATPLAGAEQNPTGTVVFYNGTTILGSAPLVAVPLTDASTATFTIQTLPGGLDTLSAAYLGDLSYSKETSNVLSLNIQSFTIAPSSTNPATNLDIVQGSAGSAAFVIAGQGGFNNLVQVVCAVPFQDDMTCTATPQQVTPTATVTFVVQTFTTGGPSSTTSAASRGNSLLPRTIRGTALAVLAFFLLPLGRRIRRFLFLFLAVLGLSGLGCNGVSGVSASGTPLGVATLKITASAYLDNTVVSQSVYLTVNVLAPGTTAP